MYSIFLGILFPQILSTYNKLNTHLHINTVQSNIPKKKTNLQNPLNLNSLHLNSLFLKLFCFPM